MIPTSRFPPSGPLRPCVPRLRRYYQDAVTPDIHLASLRFLRDRDTLRSTRPCVRSRCRRVRSLHRAWSLLTRPLRPGMMLVETSGSPKFPWSLHCSFAHVQATPAGRAFLTIRETLVLPPLIQLRRLRQKYFRGSVTWLPNSLSTLRAAGHPDTTQDSLPAAGQALPDRIFTRRGSKERFLSQLLLIDIPLSRASWRNGLFFRFLSLTRTSFAASSSARMVNVSQVRRFGM